MPSIPDVALVYGDADLLALHKPAGLLSVPGRGADKQDCLSSRVQAVYPEALVVHRLDMATSGLLLMARSPAVQRALSQAFAERRIHKQYTAIVQGQPATPLMQWQQIDLPIAADWLRRPLRVVDAANGQPSCTRMQVIGHDSHANTSRVVLEPHTGRTHQLRVHMQAIGHPILGDALYAPQAVQALAPRLLLHACLLEFAHPTQGHSVHLECPAVF